MHFHLPKPLHGWREFLGEVGIIVIGVLIALGAEQLVEALHWNQEVSGARNAMSLELGDSIGQSYERQRIDPCVDRRLDEIAQILDKAEASGRLPPLGAIGSPPWRTWVHGAWDSTQAGQVASHFSRQELTDRGAAYAFVDLLDSMGPREWAAWSQLSVIVGPGRPIERSEIAALRNAAAQARLLHRITTGAAIRLRQVADIDHLSYDRGIVEADRTAPMSLYTVCQPIPTRIPAAYNYAPFEGIVQRTIALPLAGYGVIKPGVQR